MIFTNGALSLWYKYEKKFPSYPPVNFLIKYFALLLYLNTGRLSFI